MLIVIVNRMKKLLLILLCVPLLFSCGEEKKNETENTEIHEEDKDKWIRDKEIHEENVQKEEKLQTIDTTYANGDKYVGEWRNGKYHGQGTLTYDNGGEYVGEFRNGRYDGQGTITYSSWNSNGYSGGFKRGFRYGRGTYTSPDGTKTLYNYTVIDSSGVANVEEDEIVDGVIIIK